MGWAAGPLVALEAGHGGLGGAGVMLTAGRMSPAPVSWGIHCTWGWVRVSFGDQGMGKACMLELAQEGERGQAQTRSPRGSRSCTRTSVSIWCLVCAMGWASPFAPHWNETTYVP